MASIQYVVSAQDAASATFERIAGSADHVLEKLDDIGKKTAKARVGLEGDDEAQLKIDQLDLKMAKFAKRVADGKLGVDGGAAAMLQIRKLELEMDRLNAKRAKIHIDTSALSKLSAFQPSALGTAVALSPALIPLAGQLAAAVGAVGVSFGAAALAAGAFGVVAMGNLTELQKQLTKVQAANKAALVAEQTVASKRTASQKQAIANAKELTAAFQKEFGAEASAIEKLKGTWLKFVTQPAVTNSIAEVATVATLALRDLTFVIKPVAEVFQFWGITLNTYFRDPVHAQRIRELAAAFGNFAAQQLYRIGQFIVDIGKGVFNLGRDLAANGANFSAFGPWLSGIGDAFLNWSKSSAARRDVQGFMKFIHDDGPLVKGILKDLGTLLPGVFKGATTVGTLELQALGAFLNLVAKLPKGWQAPLTEFAGAMLLLSKTGVIKVGLKLTGGALSLLSGGAIKIGGASAAATMEAAMKAGGAAAAADMRAAMAGGGAASAGEGAAGGAAASGGLGGFVARARGALKGLLAEGEVTGAGIAIALASALHLPGQKLSILKSDFKGLGDAFHQTALSFDADRHAIANTFDGVRHDLSASFAVLRHDAASTGHDIAHTFDSLRHSVASTFDTLRHGIAAAWDTIWSNTRAAVRGGINAVVGVFLTLPGRAVGALFGLGHALYAKAHAALTDFLSGFKSVATGVINWIKGFVGKIIGAIGKLIGRGSPAREFFNIGRDMMLGLELGIKAHAHRAANAAMTSVGNIKYKAGAGVAQWGPLVRRVLLMEGLNPLLAARVMYQIQTESGGNPNAINLTDINAQRGDPSRGLLQTIGSTFRAYHWPGTSNNIYDPLANIAAAINYARHVYGPTLMSGGMGLGSGHGYALGGVITEPIWGVGASGRRYSFGERGPEIVIPGMGGGQMSMARVEMLLAQILAALRIAPAATSAGVSRSLNSAARAAVR